MNHSLHVTGDEDGNETWTCRACGELWVERPDPVGVCPQPDLFGGSEVA